MNREKKTTPLIEVKNLSKTFKNGKKQAINSINFTLNRGEIVGYLGKNGAGKSTMIKILCGIMTPTNGKVLVDSIVPYEERLKNAKNIGVVFGQRTQLWWDLPVIDSFKIIKNIYKINDEEFKKRLDYYDDLFNISSLYFSLTRTLSLGERMKADIVASMLHNPPILFLDEPTIGLDFLSKENMRRAIKDINSKYNTTILLTTHDMEDVESLCERIILLDKANIMYDGSLELLKRKYNDFKHIQINDLSKDSIEKIIYKIDKLNINCKVKKNKSGLKISIKSTCADDIAKILNALMKLGQINNISLEENKLDDILNKLYKDF